MSVQTYEQQRLENIRANRELLLSLGLEPPAAPRARARPLSTPSKPRPTATPRRAAVVGADAASPSASSTSSLRRSTRTRSVLLATPSPSPARIRRVHVALTADDDDDVYHTRSPARLGMRTQDPKQFGAIPGVAVGTTWATRMACSEAAIHAPTVAGISGNAVDGAWSVALSGGYADDVDLGEAFTYTGSGGRDLRGTKTAPKNLRSAPQTSHQTFDNPLNAALKRSAETRLPVRVIRGYKLPSPYAPAAGYRYDGLYIVERAWAAPGLTRGLLVCRYAFRRVAGQPPIPDLPVHEGE